MNRGQPFVMIVGVVVLMMLVAGLWWWQRSVVRAPHNDLSHEAWERVKVEYPLPPEEPIVVAQLTPEHIEAVVRANPFAPERRRASLVPSSGGQGNDHGLISPPPKPRFVYKGRVQLGSRQRAVVEEVSSHKTYFLEVGQEVAGFKVLDISESRVLLSDHQTNEEVVVSLTATALPAPQGAAKREASSP